jgi:CubicO group peptidase (beta-lactamase class C family)
MHADPRLPAIDDLFAFFDRPGTPGCAVGVVAGGTIVHLAGYGRCSLEHDVPWTSDTPSRLASVSKWFTAMAVLAAADSGALDIDAPLPSLFPAWRGAADDVSLRLALMARSGLRYDEGLAWVAGLDTSHRYDTGHMHRLVGRQRVRHFPPGRGAQYNCSGFRLAWTILDRQGGGQVALERHVLQPAGVRGIDMVTRGNSVLPGLAAMYDADGAGWRRYLGYADSSGDGGLVGTARGLADFARAALVAGSPTQALVARTADVPKLPGRPTAYGQGCFLGTHRGTPWIGHTGGLHAHTVLALYPQVGVGIVLLANRNDINPRAMAHRVFDAVMPLAGASDPVHAVLDAADFWARADSRGVAAPPLAAPEWFVAPEQGWVLQLDRSGTAWRIDLLGLGEILEPARDGWHAAVTGRIACRVQHSPGADTLLLDIGRDEPVPFVRTRPDASPAAELPGWYWSDEASAALHIAATPDGLLLELGGGADPAARRSLRTLGHRIASDGTIAVQQRDRGASTLAVSTGRVLDLSYRRIA